eukprot:2712160-Pleurochrysis_carterae.AAC.1
MDSSYTLFRYRLTRARSWRWRAYDSLSRSSQSSMRSASYVPSSSSGAAPCSVALPTLCWVPLRSALRSRAPTVWQKGIGRGRHSCATPVRGHAEAQCRA